MTKLAKLHQAWRSIAVASLSIVLCSCSAQSSKYQLSGSILTDIWLPGTQGNRTVGRDCDVSNQGSYRDLAIGTDIRIKNSKGEIIALGKITSGTVMNVSGQHYCVVRFSAMDVPDSNFYAVALGSDQRKELTYSKEELVDKNWQLELSSL